MPEVVPFRLRLSGSLAERHEFQGYDGYMSLAGFAWTLTLAANYAETGTIRHKGDFPGRHLVRAKAIEQGSLLADFLVSLRENPSEIFAARGAAARVTPGMFFYDLIRHVVARNLGKDFTADTPLLNSVLQKKHGELEALVAATEPAIRQAHGVITNGADEIEILGGFNVIDTFNRQTRDYVRQNILDEECRHKEFSVASFNANSGHGAVFDADLGRTVPIGMSKATLNQISGIFTWGLDQYANRTQARIRMLYQRILAMDGTPKRYIVLNAERIKSGSI